jgi:hypothetical protein
MKRKALLLLFTISSFVVHSQDLNYAGVIPTFSQTGRITQRFNYNFFISETFDTFDETIKNKEYPASNLQLYIQPSIIYAYSPNLNFAASFTYNFQRSNPVASFFNELRPWQQVVYAHNLLNGRMSHRIRFEERFKKNEMTNKWPVTTRIRY